MAGTPARFTHEIFLLGLADVAEAFIGAIPPERVARWDSIGIAHETPHQEQRPDIVYFFAAHGGRWVGIPMTESLLAEWPMAERMERMAWERVQEMTAP